MNNQKKAILREREPNLSDKVNQENIKGKNKIPAHITALTKRSSGVYLLDDDWRAES